MLHRAIATLQETLRPHLGLSKDRVETLALIKACPGLVSVVRVFRTEDHLN